MALRAKGILPIRVVGHSQDPQISQTLIPEATRFREVREPLVREVLKLQVGTRRPLEEFYKQGLRLLRTRGTSLQEPFI